MRGFEQANRHTLYGIFGAAQWTNKARLSDALHKNLIEHFSRLSLRNSAAKASTTGRNHSVNFGPDHSGPTRMPPCSDSEPDNADTPGLSKVPKWSGWRDSNPRPLRPERSALPS